MAMAQRTASTTLRNSISTPSPVRLNTRPFWLATVGSMRSARRVRNRASVRSSSALAMRLNPTTSAARIAAIFRVSGMHPPPWLGIARGGGRFQRPRNHDLQGGPGTKRRWLLWEPVIASDAEATHTKPRLETPRSGSLRRGKCKTFGGARDEEARCRQPPISSVLHVRIGAIAPFGVFIAPISGAVFVFDRGALAGSSLFAGRSGGGGVREVFACESLREDVAELVSPSAVMFDDLLRDMRQFSTPSSSAHLPPADSHDQAAARHRSKRSKSPGA